MENNDVANEKKTKIPMENDGDIKRFGEDQKYLTWKRRPLGKWWNYHILLQYHYDQANVAFLDDLLNLYKALKSKDSSKWEAKFQKKYNLFEDIGMWKLTIFPKDCKIVRCK